EPDGAISAWLHASASGAITAIEPRPAPHLLGAPTLSIVIDNDGRDEPFQSDCIRFEQLAPSALLAHLARGGVVGLGGAAFPLGAKLASAARAGAIALLLNGAECEPYITCDDMLMRERAQDVVLGARILLHASGAVSCTIAIEEETPHAEQALRAAIEAAHDERIVLATVPNIYPGGGERQLIASVFGREVPHSGLPADIGVLCHNVATAAAVAQWVRDGRPLTSR